MAGFDLRQLTKIYLRLVADHTHLVHESASPKMIGPEAYMTRVVAGALIIRSTVSGTAAVESHAGRPGEGRGCIALKTIQTKPYPQSRNRGHHSEWDREAGRALLESTSGSIRPQGESLHVHIRSAIDLDSYFEFPAEEFQSLLEAESHGRCRYFLSHIRNHFSYEWLARLHVA
jgi:hypothetical protein